jgi:hypothetical protein
MTSLLDDLAVVRKRLEATSTKTLDVPGTGGLITVRYRPPEDGRDKLRDVIAVYRVGGALSADQEAQVIVDCCDEILRRSHPGADPQSYDGGPLRFDGGDERWGKDVKSARQCVAKLFALDEQPLAAAGHVDTLIDWLQGLDAEIAARAEGESERAPA